MSSSTSNSSRRAPDTSAARATAAGPRLTELAWAGLGVGLLCLALAAVNFWHDPYRVLPYGVKADSQRVALYRRANPALWGLSNIEAVLRGSDRDAEVLIIGDSRAIAMTGDFADPRTREAVDGQGRRVFNFGVAGRDIPSSLAILDRYRDRFPQAETVILVLPYDKIFGWRNPPGDLEQAAAAMDYPLSYLVNLRTLAYASRTWGRDWSLAEDRDGFAIFREREPVELAAPRRFDRPLDWRDQDTGEIPKPGFVETERVERRVRRGRVPDTLDALDLQLDALRGAHPDLDLLIYIPPMHPYYEQWLENGRRPQHYAALVERLGRHGQVYDGLFYDGAAGTMRFSDTVHLADAGPDLLQDALDCLAAAPGYQSVIAYDGQTPCRPRPE